MYDPYRTNRNSSPRKIRLATPKAQKFYKVSKSTENRLHIMNITVYMMNLTSDWRRRPAFSPFRVAQPAGATGWKKHQDRGKIDPGHSFPHGFPQPGGKGIKAERA
jgi:hypothetical protein